MTMKNSPAASSLVGAFHVRPPKAVIDRQSTQAIFFLKLAWKTSKPSFGWLRPPPSRRGWKGNTGLKL